MSTEASVTSGDLNDSSSVAGARVSEADDVRKVPLDTTTSPDTQNVTDRGEEQALESHEVIELQTFSERKAWIEEKIKFLETLPPIEVFVGLDALRSSAEEIPGLPTRAELQQWMMEHDAIEKETEIFDTGELKKLRKLTKAATQRNLSPEDTDVIELTLTTIYELDKLLHLLRDRSENLELLSIRLTWEEYRSTAWIDRRKILEELQLFINTRAQWSRTIYETAIKPDDSPGISRRGSVTSLASIGSESSITTPAFSRTARFKLAELLSRDAAQFTARATSLRHGKITAAGKALDKLIDNSRRPVPDILLDEQDRLEEKGIGDMEHVGKFIMNLVMQWRKADEIYVETIKDQIAAQNLLEEIETAKMYHPTPRQSTSFVSRADTLLKRLSLRGNPTSPSNTFPRPENPLFPDQKAANDALAQSLALDITAATELVQKVDTEAKAYRTRYEAVKRVETILQSARELSTTFSSTILRLREGIPNSDGGGSPPDLMSEICLEPTRHSVFLALLPSILGEAAQAIKGAEEVLRNSHVALFALDSQGIDPSFKTKAVAEFRQLDGLREQALSTRTDISERVTRLREARRLWATMDKQLGNMVDVRFRLSEAIEKQRWKQESGGSQTPLTPESPGSSFATLATVAEFEEELGDLASKLSEGVHAPLAILSTTLEEPLKEWLSHNAHNLQGLLETIKELLQLHDAVQRQAAVMATLRDEYNDLHVRIEDLKIHMESNVEDVLAGRLMNGHAGESAIDLHEDLRKVQENVDAFTSSLSGRVIFVARHSIASPGSPAFVKRRFSSGDLKLGALVDSTSIELPFDLTSHDASVRADSNYYAMRLAGEMEGLKRIMSHLDLAHMAKQLDSSLLSVVDDINAASQEISSQRQSMLDITQSKGDIVDNLGHLLADVEEAVSLYRKKLPRSFSPLREVLRRMDASSSFLGTPVRETLYVARMRAVDDAESRFRTCDEAADSLKDDIISAQRVELQRLEEMRLAEQLRKRELEARLVAEEAERNRLEQEQKEEEERLRLAKERAAEQERLEHERERLAREEAERARVEKIRVEAEERERLEQQQLAEAKRLQVEKERIAFEEAERIRLNREKDEMQMKLRLAEEELAMERRLQSERQQASTGKEMEELPEETADEMSVQSTDGADEGDSVILPHDLSVIEEDSIISVDSQDLDDDVFGLRIAPSDAHISKTQEMLDLQSEILSLRKRLRSLSINESVRPSKSSSSHLPNEEFTKRIMRDFLSVSSDVANLPLSCRDVSINAELRSLRAEVEASAELLKQLEKLVDLSKAVQLCDAALSDLLEHIDSYPALPLGVMGSSHQPPLDVSSEQQMAARLAFTRDAIIHMDVRFSLVERDSRAMAERTRILQTWGELEEMGNDRLGGKKSRPASVISSRNSSGRNSSASVVNSRASKKAGYAQLSVSSTSRGRLLSPPQTTPRRAASGSNESHSRSSSRVSNASNASFSRSVSGPLNLSSLYGSTFASRQRTTSLSASPVISPPSRRPSDVPLRTRTQTAQSRRSVSPSVSEASTHSRSFIGHSRTSTSSISTWSRAPRNSLSSMIPRVTTPQKKGVPPRKKYVADPKNKLDVAVGDVVNKLPVGINIEGVSETWKDQSGKYWIGNQDPKLCFCRILRSQTVMVRVGGGWTELSKFIKDHFADSFRLLPESPPRTGTQEEKWISSASLLKEGDTEMPPQPPRTPEPSIPFVPSFSLSTPSGHSPRSVRSSPSTKGSPLTPLQFMRRAEMDTTSIIRPVTPSKSSLRTRTTPSHTPASRNSIWRP
ncbi:hypothetical protein BDQ12DRAFT_674586 [Crucibulum laeve]|uniref:GAR domain-containing protein n=1 Tax=Crucibulum laeve TaxID=68775 RepID=A0A5C3MDD3_9AGAR|nr:hypothetical protein BDQ12DRAFT_674586 [Crucibulum laeve]